MRSLPNIERRAGTGKENFLLRQTIVKLAGERMREPNKHSANHSSRDHRSADRDQRVRWRGFTLVEMLAVVLIIMLLMALVVGISRYVTYKSAVARAQADISAIALALEAYKSDNNTYPLNSTSFTSSSTDTDYASAAAMNSAVIYPALYLNPYMGVGVRKTPYLQFKDEQLGATITPRYRPIIDPWGNAYNYDAVSSCPDVRRNITFDLWSSGKDGKTNRNSGSYMLDDITNFKP
jgi:type II secretory pathway pseudopilin PulG